MNKLFIVLVLSLLIIPSISAFEFDNVKNYNPETKTVEVRNSILGIPFLQLDKVAEITLDTPLINYVLRGENRQVAEFTIKNYKSYNQAFKKMEFYNKKNNEEIERDFVYKYKTITGTTERDLYEQKCTNVYSEENKTEVEKCTQVKIGVENIPIIEWVELNTDDELPEGEIIVGIFTDVLPRESVEWVPTLFGVEVREWATWEDSYNNGLVLYYKLDGTVGAVVDSTVNGNDGTNNGADRGVTGLVGNAFDFERSSEDNVSIDDPIDIDLPVTFNAWVKIEDLTGNQAVMGAITGEGGFYFSNSLVGSGILWAGKSGETDCRSATATMGVGSWHMLTYVWNASGLTYYINGTEYDTVACAFALDSAHYTLGNFGSNYGAMDGILDEVGLWNRSLNGIEITALWNGGAGLTYVTNTGPTITLVSPENYYNTTDPNIDFNVTIIDEGGVSDVTFFINGAVNITNSSDVNGTYIFNLTDLAEGNYTWSVGAEDNEGAVSNSSTYSFTIDYTSPTYTITSPTSNYTAEDTPPQDIALNITVADDNLDNCWYVTNENSTATIYTCNTNVTINFTGTGEYTINFSVNDTLGNINTTSISYWINLISKSFSYKNKSIEGTNETYYFNITAVDIQTASANLSFNGTTYPLNLINNNGTLAKFSRIIISPMVNSDQNLNLNVSYLMGTWANTTANHTLRVYDIPELNVTNATCNTTAFKFSLFDEETLGAISGDIAYNFVYGYPGNLSAIRSYGNLSSTSVFYLCYNDTIRSEWNLTYGEIQYSTDNHVDRRYYLFNNTILNNDTINVSLYDLNISRQTSFKLEVEDTSLSPYADVYTTLIRWYPATNSYTIVDMGNTDDKGSTVVHVKTEDVDYKIGVYYKNGTLIYLAEPIRMVCLLSPCTYTLKISPGDTDYTSILNIDYSFDFNETTGIWDFVYSDSTGKTSTMNLTIWKDTGTTSYVICNNTVSGASGVLTCNTSAYTGKLRAEVRRAASPDVILVQKVAQIITSAFKSSWGLWLSLLIAIPIMFFTAMISPVAALIGAVVALIPALYLGSVNIVIVGSLAILAGIVAHFIRRVS